MSIESKDGWFCIEGTPTAESLRALGDKGAIDRLSIRSPSLLTAKLAEHLKHLRSVDLLWLSSEVTRTAMRHVLRIPQLRVLYVLGIKPPGRLVGFAEAQHLTTVRADCHLSESDDYGVRIADRTWNPGSLPG